MVTYENVPNFCFREISMCLGADEKYFSALHPSLHEYVLWWVVQKTNFFEAFPLLSLWDADKKKCRHNLADLIECHSKYLILNKNT